MLNYQWNLIVHWKPRGHILKELNLNVLKESSWNKPLKEIFSMGVSHIPETLRTILDTNDGSPYHMSAGEFYLVI